MSFKVLVENDLFSKVGSYLEDLYYSEGYTVDFDKNNRGVSWYFKLRGYSGNRLKISKSDSEKIVNQVKDKFNIDIRYYENDDETGFLHNF